MKQLTDNEQTKQGYLNQPEMRTFVQTALDLGWTLLAYEADLKQRPKKDVLSDEVTNWREETQARNLVAELRNLQPHAQLLVWCGNGHLTKKPLPWIKTPPQQASELAWVPMGYWLRQLSGLDPFAIDQTLTVCFPGSPPTRQQWDHTWLSQLEVLGGTMGFLKEEVPQSLMYLSQMPVDAFLLSVHNDME